MDHLVDSVLQLAFGDEKMPEEAHINELKIKLGILIKKLHVHQRNSPRTVEDLANLLLLLQNEPDERISLLTMEDLQAIAASFPSKNHDVDEEEVEPEVFIENLRKRNELLASRMYYTPRLKKESLEKELVRREQAVLSYINDALIDMEPSLKFTGPLRSNNDFIKIAKAISDRSHTYESKDKGIYLATEHDAFKDKAGVNDDVSVVLIKLAESLFNTYLANGRPFQEELSRIKEECRRRDAEEHHDQSLEYLRENVQVDWERSMPTDIGFESESSVKQRVYTEERLDELEQQKNRILVLHKQELDEIVNVLKEHNKRQFLRGLQQVRQEADSDQKDVEKIITEIFAALETRSAELSVKYTSLFQKARLSIIEQFESSRNSLYRGDDNTDGREGFTNGLIGDPFMASSKVEETDNSADGVEMANKQPDAQLLPWKVAVERDLTKFNMDIIHNFEKDNASIFAQHCQEVASEGKEKIDKYLKF